MGPEVEGISPLLGPEVEGEEEGEGEERTRGEDKSEKLADQNSSLTKA